MTRSRIGEWIRARAPQTIRVRLSLFYAALFLLAGAALLALTYGLVANSLPRTAPSAVSAAQQAKAALACAKTAGLGAGGAGGRLKPQPVKSDCKHVFSAGENAGASSQRDQTLHNLLLLSLLGLGLMTVVSGGLGWLMAGRVLRPVRSITEAARRASEENLGDRLHMQGPNDELKELADTFDGMLDRLDAAFAAQSRFVADASHELRTPLTVMRTAIDVTLAKPARSPEQLEAMAEKVRRSADQAESLIEALLTLARSDQVPSSPGSANLATMAEDALESSIPEIEHLGLRLKVDLRPAETTGDQMLLERMVGNLVENAVRHNDQGGWIDVIAGTADGSAFLTVSNSGPVIPDEIVDELFEPFRRLEVRTNTRQGVGLGLAIVRSIAQAHGAEIEARSQLGGGMTISVILKAEGG